MTLLQRASCRSQDREHYDPERVVCSTHERRRWFAAPHTRLNHRCFGRETAIQFATVGATVVAIDRDGNGCSQTVEEVQKQGGAALALECDVSEAESVSVAASRALAAFGRCDVLINNAGVLQPGRLEVLSLVDW